MVECDDRPHYHSDYKSRYAYDLVYTCGTFFVVGEAHSKVDKLQQIFALMG